MQELGQYYTRTLFSTLLVSNITVENPSTILELGVGNGSLTKAAFGRWSNASFIATDIDKGSVTRVGKSMPFVKIVKADGLSSSLSNELSIKVDSMDVAVCNPPFLRLGNKSRFDNLFESASLPGCSKMSYITTDVVFLAQNLLLLKSKGQLGIILPDNIVSGKDFKLLRSSLLENHKISKIIQLPGNIFSKTEAFTHIMIIEKGSTTDSYVDIFNALRNGNCEKQLSVQSSVLIDRMDFKFHAHRASTLSTNAKISLSEIGAEVLRGNIEQKDLKPKNISKIHTTNLPHGHSSISFKRKLHQKYVQRYVVAQRGDILVARVGSRACTGKVSMVKKGYAVVSDCILIVRVLEIFRQDVYRAMTSEAGQNWLKAVSHGVCAKFISKHDLLKFPIPIPENSYSGSEVRSFTNRNSTALI